MTVSSSASVSFAYPGSSRLIVQNINFRHGGAGFGMHSEYFKWATIDWRHGTSRSINYTPATIAFTTAIATGNLTGTVTNTDHPNSTGGADGIDSTKDATRYWTLKGSTVAGTYTATLNYVSGDIKVGATQATLRP